MAVLAAQFLRAVLNAPSWLRDIQVEYSRRHGVRIVVITDFPPVDVESRLPTYVNKIRVRVQLA